MDATCLAWALALVPILWQLIRHWNFLIFVWKHERGGGRRMPDGNMGLPFIGETLSFLWYFKYLRRPDDYIAKKKKRYGEGIGMYKTHIFGEPAIIACSPASVKFVFQSKDFKIRWPDTALVGKEALVAVEGTAHTRLRNFIINAINQPNALRGIALLVQPRIVDALQSWAKKGTIVAANETKKVTFENILMMFANIKPGPITDTLDLYFRGLIKGLRAYKLNIPGTAFHYSYKCRRNLTAVFRKQLEKKKALKQIGRLETNDIMDRLMEVTDDDGNKLSDSEVVDNIVSFVVAGYESTALGTMWALCFLYKTPHVLQKLREENAAIKKEKEKGEFITVDEISQLKYTAKVVEETIRLANIAPFVYRAATTDVEYKGYKIPKGWTVLAWVRSLHTDPDNFDDPMNFNPERWNKPAKPGTFQVFGGGPRICAGNMLARIQLSIILHHLSLGYKWKLINKDVKIDYLPHPRPVDGAVMEFHEL